MRVPSFHAFRAGRASVVVVLKQLWSWGANSTGQLGLGDVITRSSPVQVGALTDWSSISGGNTVATAIKTDGTLWSWGSNSLGELGLGNATARSSPVQVGALTSWSKVSSGFQCAFAIKTDGTLWSWGASGYGRLGLGDAGTNRSSPVQVGALTTWSVVSVSSHSLAVKTDGTLWSWGHNTHGQLGLGDVTLRSSPVQVGALTTWSSVVAALGSSFAVKTDGTLWSWGRNNSGGLGLGDATNRSSPVQVGALTTWSSKIDASGIFGPYGVGPGTVHVLAVKTDGTLWSWGASSQGQLGLGDVTARSSPVQVGALTTWNECACGMVNFYGRGFSSAIKTDGTLWTWGDNTALGLGDFTNRSSPVQVGALTTWISVSLCGGVATRGNAGAMLALRS